MIGLLSTQTQVLNCIQNHSLYIVIVNWNLKEDTLVCLDSLLEAGASIEQVIMIDNGSDDGSMDAFTARHGVIFASSAMRKTWDTLQPATRGSK